MCASLVSQSCLTLCNPLDYSLPDSSVQGISQARILEWVAIFSSRGSSRARDQTCVSCISCIGKQIIYHYAIWKAQGIWVWASKRLGLGQGELGLSEPHVPFPGLSLP